MVTFSSPLGYISSYNFSSSLNNCKCIKLKPCKFSYMMVDFKTFLHEQIVFYMIIRKSQRKRKVEVDQVVYKDSNCICLYMLALVFSSPS